MQQFRIESSPPSPSGLEWCPLSLQREREQFSSRVCTSASQDESHTSMRVPLLSVGAVGSARFELNYFCTAQKAVRGERTNLSLQEPTNRNEVNREREEESAVPIQKIRLANDHLREDFVSSTYKKSTNQHCLNPPRINTHRRLTPDEPSRRLPGKKRASHLKSSVSSWTRTTGNSLPRSRGLSTRRRKYRFAFCA